MEDTLDADSDLDTVVESETEVASTRSALSGGDHGGNIAAPVEDESGPERERSLSLAASVHGDRCRARRPGSTPSAADECPICLYLDEEMDSFLTSKALDIDPYDDFKARYRAHFIAHGIAKRPTFRINPLAAQQAPEEDRQANERRAAEQGSTVRQAPVARQTLADKQPIYEQAAHGCDEVVVDLDRA